MTTILCLASYFKGEELIRECKRLGCRVLLLTVEKLRDAAWPRESIDDVFYMPDLYRRDDVVHGVSYLARTERIARIIPLDEFDQEMAAALREHLRIGGMGETPMRFFRDKLAMRLRASEAGILVPAFVPVLHLDGIREFLTAVPPPWLLKPRFSASAVGIKLLDDPEQVWRAVDELGDRRSFHLLERFVRGHVLHVDSVRWAGEMRLAEAHAYVDPPFAVYHGGGLFCTRSLERDSPQARALTHEADAVLRALGMASGVAHTEFIQGDADGRYYFLETAARVGGAHIVELVEAATGINLWREWARLEVAEARGEDYTLPEPRHDYAGLLISLARQEWPDMSAYRDPEVVWRIAKSYHAGLVVASPDPHRVRDLLEAYMPRFRDDFYASLPAPETPVD